jgi:predicted DNA-binding protein
MKRTTIWLTDTQVGALAQVSKKTGMQQSKIIRRCIDAGLQERRLDWGKNVWRPTVGQIN